MAVSNAMVRIYKETFGRGPTKARTNFAGPDILICTLRETLTPAERRLVELDEHERLRETRMYFQHAVEPEFRHAVEEITGRKVEAFVSGIDTSQDLASEIFYLEPEADESLHLA
ncbi:MAG TPA: Na-translocating system protein MpsC family protein [Thermoleophilaceae bacterium]|nr:Na-translocating system protein MpsC family protein [Thermoleophilaceae bacterium]